MKRLLIAVPMLCVLAFVVTNCSAGKAPPQTQVAHYETAVLGAATALQKGVTAATDSKALPVKTAQEITGYVEQVYVKSGNLNTALVAYNAATTIDVKKLKAADVQQLVGDLNTILGNILKVSIPPGAANEIVSLASKVIAAIGVVQSEIAKGLGQ